MKFELLGDNLILDYYIRDEFGKTMFNNCPELPTMISNLGNVLQLLKAYGCDYEDFKGIYFKNNTFYITCTEEFYEDFSYTDDGVSLKEMLFDYCYPSGDMDNKENGIVIITEGLFMSNEENCLYYLDNSDNIFHSVKNYKDFDIYLNIYLKRKNNENFKFL